MKGLSRFILVLNIVVLSVSMVNASEQQQQAQNNRLKRFSQMLINLKSNLAKRISRTQTRNSTIGTVAQIQGVRGEPVVAADLSPLTPASGMQVQSDKKVSEVGSPLSPTSIERRASQSVRGCTHNWSGPECPICD